jgi:prophage regulatory protein
MSEALIRLKEVERRTGYRRERLRELEQEGRFPRRVRLGERACAWVESEVAAWVAARIAERDAERAA